MDVNVLNSKWVICSTITLRHLSLAEALAQMSGLGVTEIDLAALPGVCDQVPYLPEDAAVAQVAAVVQGSRLSVRSVNADVGDLSRPLTPAEQDKRLANVDQLVGPCRAIGAAGFGLPNGARDRDPIADLDDDLDRVADSLSSWSTATSPMRDPAAPAAAVYLNSLLRVPTRLWRARSSSWQIRTRRRPRPRSGSDLRSEPCRADRSRTSLPRRRRSPGSPAARRPD
jgi:hypothetical protein